jgi:hypothetical protein
MLSLFLGSFLLLPLLARGQDATPSLADIARKARQQKQSEEPQAQSSKPAIVINEENVAPQGSVASQVSKVGNRHPFSGASAAKDGKKLTAEQWKAQILEQKSQIASLQTSSDQLAQSIHFHSSSPTQVRWNERQREKQHQMERLQIQLQEKKKHLEEMQEAARRQGYGSVVYDP